MTGMRRVRAAWVRLAGLVRGGREAQAFDDELESHLQLHTDDNLRAGMPLEDARRRAVLKLGGIEATREARRDQSSVPFLEHLGQDLRFTVRHLVKAPGFATTAIATLALGLGAATAIYAFVDVALVRPLPYANPSRLVDVTERTPEIPHANLSYADYLDWKRLNTVFSAFDFHQGRRFALTTRAGLEPVPGARVSAGFFGTLGVAPILGRDFHAGEDQPGVAATAIIGYATWQARYAGDPSIVGRAVTLDGEPATVVGVLPPAFIYAPRGPVEFWVPFHAAEGSCDTRRGCHGLTGVARLKDGVSVEAARAETTRIAADLEREYPDTNKSQGAVVQPLADYIVGDIRPVLLVLLAGVGLLLVIACVNVVSLLLVRSEGRRREIAVRSTLGASMGRLARQFATEAVVLAAGGAVAGLAGAVVAIRLLSRLLSEDMLSRMPYLESVAMNWRVMAFAAALGTGAAIVLAAVPVIRLRFSGVREGLSEGARGSSGTTWRRLGFKLVVLELATAMVLLVGAALLGQSLYRLLRVNLGFEPDRLVAINVAGPGSRFASDEAGIRMAHDVTDRVARLPGVRSVGLIDMLPVSFNGNTTWIRFAGRPFNGEHNEVLEREISAGYFDTVGARMLAGRGFTDRDVATSPKVAVINHALARKYFGRADPIGTRVGNFDFTPDAMMEIVGVVDDIREGALDEEIWPAIYYPIEQSPTRYFAVVARTAADEGMVLPALAAAIHEVDRDIVTMPPSIMRERIVDSPAAALQRSSAWLVGGFAGLALLLGVIGLYGVIAYSVSQRTREIGVRMALGAQARTVYELVLGEAARLVAAGLTIGAVLSVGAASLAESLLFGTTPWDVPTLAGVAVVLGGAALVASYLPARHAASVDPVEALRAE